MSLLTKYRGGFSTILTGSGDLANPVQTVPFGGEGSMTNGTTDRKADQLFSDVRTLAASTSEELDLAAALVDAFGATLTFVKIRGIYIVAAAANTGNIVVGGAASNAFAGPFADDTDKVELPAEAYVEWVNPKAGWAVTAGTGDLLKIENDDSGASASYTIQIIGTSA